MATLCSEQCLTQLSYNVLSPALYSQPCDSPDLTMTVGLATQLKGRMERAFLAAATVRKPPAKASKSLDIAFPDSERLSTGSRLRSKGEGRKSCMSWAACDAGLSP